ncbi:GPI-anchored small secreted protein [Mycena leptocephala]|nr:GPI-anchored small secreted protein [Mycena leptocephala]
MLVLHMLTTVLTISYAKANPVEIILPSYNKRTPTTDPSTGTENYLTAVSDAVAFASPYLTSTGTSLARPMVTSLTKNYLELEKRACIDQFAWYCQLPAGACIASLPASLVALLVGFLCCKGIIPNCSNAGDAKFLSLAAESRPITGNVMAALSGGSSPDHFTKQQFKDEYYGFLSRNGATAFPTDAEFNGFYKAFQFRMFCSFGPGESGPVCTPDTISRSEMESYMMGF